jgi:UDP-N-acetylmuramate: L-alanyl-gamma-D-glutamyl-meso-diaminopimelate ligase
MSAKTQNIHFIAIGGSAMHNLALALNSKGYQVTGSDEQIFEPSKSRLEKKGLSPQKQGWFPEKIHSGIDAVILGVNAKKDNPELLKAKELNLKIYSFAEYIYKESEHKQRIVVAGSHGKTSIVSMVLHVLKYHKREIDYVLDTEIEGLDGTVKLSNAPTILIEGDECLASPIDETPNFLHYHHHIGLISGIDWNHIEIFPTIDEYVKQFELFADATPKAGLLIYCECDDIATLICRKERNDVQTVEYEKYDHKINNGTTFLKSPEGEIPLKIFGNHHLRNLSGAKALLSKVGISEKMFLQAIQSYEGLKDRLELIEKNNSTSIFKDFADSPAKLEAATNAVSKQYSGKELIGVFELSTLSSLSKEFLTQYKKSFNAAKKAIVYFNPEKIKEYELEMLNEEEIIKAFKHPDLKVFTDSQKLQSYLLELNWNNRNLLLMTSSDMGGINFKEFSQKIISL